MPLKQIISLIITISLFACQSKTTKDTQSKESLHMNHEGTTAIGYADSVNNGLIIEDTMKKSVPRTAMATINSTHLHISYHSPGVKGRIIWGGLVPYNTVWVTGAHTATSITFNNEMLLAGKTIEPGTYAIFTIPGEKEWTFILNRNYKQHLTDDYSEKEDVLRYNVIPEPDTLTQRLTWTIQKEQDTKGSISMFWEKLKISIPFEIKK
jgi:hypothetical protein